MSESSNKQGGAGTLIRPVGLKYMPGFVLFEERAPDGTRLFPMTKQLEAIHNAARREFLEGLDVRLQNTDHSAGARRKFLLYCAAASFCAYFNPPGYLFFPIMDHNGVTTIGVVQHIRQDTPLGALHRFRFYVGSGGLLDLYLSGRRVWFTQHVIERFALRVQNRPRLDLAHFLQFTLSRPAICMRVNGGDPALLAGHYMSAPVAFIFKCVDDGINMVTCMTSNELWRLEPCQPMEVMHFHFGQNYIRPPIGERHKRAQQKLLDAWKEKVIPRALTRGEWTWPQLAATVYSQNLEAAVRQDVAFGFLDGIYGPAYQGGIDDGGPADLTAA